MGAKEGTDLASTHDKIAEMIRQHPGSPSCRLSYLSTTVFLAIIKGVISAQKWQGPWRGNSGEGTIFLYWINQPVSWLQEACFHLHDETAKNERVFPKLLGTLHTSASAVAGQWQGLALFLTDLTTCWSQLWNERASFHFAVSLQTSHTLPLGSGLHMHFQQLMMGWHLWWCEMMASELCWGG